MPRRNGSYKLTTRTGKTFKSTDGVTWREIAGKLATNLFIPLKTQYYRAFEDGSKTTEYRQYGPRWNERTCCVGRRVIISHGYGKKERLTGTVVGFEKKRMATKSWVDCYGTPGLAACIQIELDK